MQIFFVATALVLGLNLNTQVFTQTIDTATVEHSVESNTDTLKYDIVTDAIEQPVTISFEYPKLVGNSASIRYANKAILNLTLDRFSIEHTSTKSAVKSYKEAYLKDVKEENGYIRGFISSTNLTLNAKEVISVFQITDAYDGGAHGSNHATLQILDLNAKKQLFLEDIFKVGYEASLKKIAQKYFAKALGLPMTSTEKDLIDEGFWFNEGFVLAKNFGCTKTHFIMYYNPYDVAAYVMGPTEVQIPFTALKDLMKKDNPLKAVIQ